MPSKTSKPSRKPPSQPPASIWKAATGCSERELLELGRLLATSLVQGDRVLIEGPMGVGKTTFSRALLKGLGVLQPPEGSPTFAIAHEYHAPRGDVVHVDFYRLKYEAEIEEAGIESYFWERGVLVLAEWTSLFPKFEAALLKTKESRNWLVKMSFAEDPAMRDIEIRLGK